MLIAHGTQEQLALTCGAAGLPDRMAAIESRLERPAETLAAAEIDGAIADFEAVAPVLRAYAGA